MTTAGRPLGLDALTYLRALAQGISAEDAARRFLNVTGGAVELRQAHRAIVDEVRTLARRRGDPAWRLIGAELAEAGKRKRAGEDPQTADVPSLEEWAEQEGLDGFPADELLETYQRRFDIAPDDPTTARRQARNERLRVRRLELLRQLEKAAGESAKPDDRLSGWLDPTLAGRLETAGIRTLGELRLKALMGDRWWRDIPAIGDGKATVIAAQVERLLANGGAPRGLGRAAPGSGHSQLAAWSIDWKRAMASGGGASTVGAGGAAGEGTLPDVRAARLSTNVVAAIDATDDRSAAAAWVAARQGSPLTVRQYTREAERFLLWARLERGRSLGELSVDDCRAYMAFLQAVPETWISKRKVAPYTPGWAPFAGQPGLVSRKYAVSLLHAMCAFLVEARYLAFNPWALVNRKLADDARPRGRSGKAFTPQAWAALLAELERPAPKASSLQANERLRWLCAVGEATGLRSAELIRATKADFETTRVGAVLHVLGKGSKHRQVPLPKVAVAATERYFQSRGLDWPTVPPKTPLLASLEDPMRPIGYDALYETFTRFVKRAMARSDLEVGEREAALRASLHWLRHTHGTRFAERGGPPDVLQANLGHSDPRTSAGYYPAQLERRQQEAEKAFA